VAGFRAGGSRGPWPVVGYLSAGTSCFAVDARGPVGGVCQRALREKRLHKDGQGPVKDRVGGPPRESVTIECRRLGSRFLGPPKGAVIGSGEATGLRHAAAKQKAATATIPVVFHHVGRSGLQIGIVAKPERARAGECRKGVTILKRGR